MTSGKMIQAYRVVIVQLKGAGIKPKKHVLDNEASVEFKQEIKEHGLEYELIPKCMQGKNVSEKAIQKWKAHVIGVFSSLPSLFPMSLWDELPPNQHASEPIAVLQC